VGLALGVADLVGLGVARGVADGLGLGVKLGLGESDAVGVGVGERLGELTVPWRVSAKTTAMTITMAATTATAMLSM
jgi:hypothetical protein